MRPLKLTIALVFLLSAALLAGRLAGAQPGARPEATRALGPTGVMLPPADPMASEMQRELDHQQQAYAALLADLGRAKSEDEAFAIQAELARDRVGLQVALLRIEAAYARRAGRERLAWQLERTIDVLISPDEPRPRKGDERGRM